MLLSAAEAAGFEVIVTVDQEIESAEHGSSKDWSTNSLRCDEPTS
jgi:hypothetical protein